MERTLKEDLQDDLQVLVDLIQHSCKPHPRPPRAGMKTLIVQGRILAEAIAQDALFQLDPSDPSAPRPDRDLVDLINRLREHHPDSLLAPALHGLRTLGNTAVHLDRDSARLTDCEIGDAAAVCCRLVVHVVDCYMQMCANLHRHEQTRDALAQPLLEAPVAPIPAPNVLLRPQVQPPHDTAAAAPLPPSTRTSLRSLPSDSALLTRQQTEEVELGVGGGGGACSSSMNGGRPTLTGSFIDGSASLQCRRVCSDLSAPPPLLAPTSDGGSSGSSPGEQARGSRAWWPPALPTEASAALQPPPPVPTTLLRCSDGRGQSQALCPEVLSALVRPADTLVPPQPQLLTQPPVGALVLSRIQGQPLPYGLPGAPWLAPSASTASCEAAGAASSRWRSSGSNGGGGSGGGGSHGFGEGDSSPATAPPPSQVPFARTLAVPPASRQPLPSSAQSGPDTAAASPYFPSNATVFTASGSAAAAVGAGAAVAGFSAAFSDANGNHVLASMTAAGVPSYDPPVSAAHSRWAGQLQLQQPQHATEAHQQRQPDPCAQTQEQQPQLWAGSNGAAQAQGPGSSAGAGGAVATPLSPAEASKRLLQLCAASQTPPAVKVERLLQAGASLALTDKSGMTALHMACYWCHAETARLLLSRQPSAAAAADREARTPLWVAAQRGHVEVVALLLGLTEGVMQVDVPNAAGVTPLRVASAQGHHEVVVALLRAGASVDRADKDGFTPIYVAAARSQLEVVRALLDAAAPVDRADKAQRTPLWAALHPGGSARADACPERRAAVVRALLAAGADVHLLPDARDREYCWQLLAQSIAAGE